MKIKQLEWNYKLNANGNSRKIYTYTTSINYFTYRIQKMYYVKEDWSIYFGIRGSMNINNINIGNYAKIEQAKQMAQQHFENEVKQYLESEV